MKKLKYLLILALPLGVLVSGCEKFNDFGDTNVNPGATTMPDYPALLTNVESQIGGYAVNTRGALYSQYFSETQYTDASLYSLPKLEFNGDYSGPMADLQNIINSGYSNDMTQISRILKAYIFWTITDKWGDVPYSEALLGLGNTNPKYDSQETIYKGIIQELTEAVDAFDNTSVIRGDVINGGDVGKWKKAANSLRLLMALQLSKRYPGAGDYAATEFKAALGHSAGVIESNDDNFDVEYPGGGFKSPLWGLYDGRKDYAESQTMTNLLGSFSDGRANVFGGSNESPSNTTASTVGVPYGLERASAEAFTGANPTWARVFRGDYRQENGVVTVVGAAQVLLARAEAADRGWTTENAKQMYEAGITASFDQWGITVPASYLSQSGVVFSAAAGSGANLKQIATQEYIAGYPNGLYGWNLWRRTGYPELTPAPDAVNATKEIPRRYVYGDGEYATNKESVEAAVSVLGEDTQDKKVWWDQ